MRPWRGGAPPSGTARLGALAAADADASLVLSAPRPRSLLAERWKVCCAVSGAARRATTGRGAAKKGGGKKGKEYDLSGKVEIEEEDDDFRQLR